MLTLTFRQKIFISYLILIAIFMALVFPFASSAVSKIAFKAMQDRSTEIIAKLEEATDDNAIIRLLKDEKPLLFFRVSVITDQRKVLYDSHTKHLLGAQFSRNYVVDHPEVLEAFKYGEAYHEDYSELLGQKFAYFAKTFDFHGKTYVLRTAFPFRYVVEIAKDFEWGIIFVAVIILSLFSLITWFTTYYLSKPIAQIISAVRPYQEGRVTSLPLIDVMATSTEDFQKLAQTLNSLSQRIRNQIDNLTEERNEKKTTLESLVEGVIAVDKTLHITYANQAAMHLMGITDHDIVGRPFSSLNDPQCLKMLEECLKENKQLIETRSRKNGVARLFLDLVAAPKTDLSGAILVIQDKTAQHKMLEMRKDFVANASHELKTPITIIQGFAETLHDNPDLPKEIVTEATTKIVRNCERMTELIKDLLTLSDIENIPETRLVDCDLVPIAEHCAAIVRDLKPDAQISIIDSSGTGVHLLADPSLIELALMNLVLNAAKYSLPPAQITVTLSYEGKFVKISVADKGIGIPEADLESIFDRFYTVNKAHSQMMGGSGLGLAIVQTVVEKHQGKISVQSELNKGTTFTILFPIRS